MIYTRIESPGQLVFVLIVAALLSAVCLYLGRPK